MALSASEEKQLRQELVLIQRQNPGVVVRGDMAQAALDAAQARVDEIEGILASGIVKRTPSADLEA